jgi:hypothetical protein
VLKGSAVYGRAARALIIGILSELDRAVPSSEAPEVS